MLIFHILLLLMKLIKPNLISGEILTLFDEADEKVIIVSPYCRFQKWHKLKGKLKSLKNRGIATEFYIREGEPDTFEEVHSLGISPVQVKGLHCKIYMNEKYAIVSSMNLLLSSEIASIEIAYKTENHEEYLELMEFFERNIRKNQEPNVNQQTLSKGQNALFEKLSENKIRFWEESDLLVMKTENNNYRASIFNASQNKHALRINGILSQIEFEHSQKIVSELEKMSGLKIECIEGEGNHYHMIWGVSMESLSTENILNPVYSEMDYLANCIVKFIGEVEKIKEFVYYEKKAGN